MRPETFGWALQGLQSASPWQCLPLESVVLFHHHRAVRVCMWCVTASVLVVQGAWFKIIFKQSLTSYCAEHAASNENGSELQKWENSKLRVFKGKMWAIMSFYLSLNSSLTRTLCWWTCAFLCVCVCVCVCVWERERERKMSLMNVSDYRICVIL